MIIVVQSSVLPNLPPLVSLMRMLKDRGEKVAYLGVTDYPATRMMLEELNIPYRLYKFFLVAFRANPKLNVWYKLTNWIRPYLRRKWLWQQVDELSKGEDEVVIWSADMYASALLGDKARKYGRKFIQTIYELGEESGKDLFGFNIKRLYKEATIIECEYNRAHILKAEKGIERLPFVVPNKPYAHPEKRGLPISDAAAAKVVESWNGKRVILYQGALQSDRTELVSMITALCEGLPEAIVAIMGKRNEFIEGLERKYPNFSYVPFVCAPHHLEVTSHADVGLAYYQGGAMFGLSPLNPIYCAPNKIFEYGGFGFPMLCNDIPGLRYSVAAADFGICLEKMDKQSVVAAAKKLLGDYEHYSANAKKYYDSIDNVATIGEILKYARSGE